MLKKKKKGTPALFGHWAEMLFSLGGRCTELGGQSNEIKRGSCRRKDTVFSLACDFPFEVFILDFSCACQEQNGNSFTFDFSYLVLRVVFPFVCGRQAKPN